MVIRVTVTKGNWVMLISETRQKVIRSKTKGNRVVVISGIIRVMKTKGN